jgi:hypothetical protein
MTRAADQKRFRHWMFFSEVTELTGVAVQKNL